MEAILGFSDSSSSSSDKKEETDEQILEAQKIEQLEEINKQLAIENTQLKAQVDQACKLNQNYDELHKINRKLTKQIRDLNSEKENLLKKIEIIKGTNEDLQEKISEEKKASLQLHRQDVENMEKEIKKVKAHAKSQQDELHKQIDKLNSEKDKKEMDFKLMHKKVDRLLDRAAKFHEQEFKNIESLISFLNSGTNKNNSSSRNNSSMMSPSPSKSRTQMTIQSGSPARIRTTSTSRRAPSASNFHSTAPLFNFNDDSQQIANLEKKLKRERSKTKSLTSAKESLESQIEKMNREVNDVKSQHQREIEQLNKKIRQAMDDQAMAEAESRNTITNLQAKIDDFKEKIKELKKDYRQKLTQSSSRNDSIMKPQIFTPSPMQQFQPIQQSPQMLQSPPVQQYYQPPQKNTSSDDDTHEQDMDDDYYSPKRSPQRTPSRRSYGERAPSLTPDPATERLINQNIELTEEIKSVKARFEKVSKQNRRANKRINELELQLSKEKHEMESLQIIHKETIADLENTRNALLVRPDDSSEKKLIRREFQNMKARIQNLTSMNETSKKQLEKVTLDYKEAQHTIDQLNDMVKDLQEEVQQEHEKNDRIQHDLTTCQAELENKPDVAPDQVIPDSIWKADCFDSDLNKEIDKICSNESLQPSSKLKNIYAAILKHYDDIAEENNKIKEEEQKEKEKVENDVNQFLVDLLIALELQPIKMKEFFEKEIDKKVLETLTDIRNCHDDLKRHNEINAQGISRIGELLMSINSIQAPSSPDNSVNNVTFNTNDIDLNNLDDIESIANEIQAKILNLNEELKKKGKKVRELTASLKSTNKKAETDAEESKAQQKKMEEAHNDLNKEKGELAEENEKLKNEIQQIRSEFNDFQQKHENKTEKLKDKIEQANDEKENAIAQCNEQIRIISDQCRENSASYQEQIQQLKTIVDQQQSIIKEHESKKKSPTKKGGKIKKDDSSSEESIDEVKKLKKENKELKQQNEAQKKQVEDLSKALDETREQVSQLKKEKNKVEAQLKSKSEQIKNKNQNQKDSSSSEEIQPQEEQEYEYEDE